MVSVLVSQHLIFEGLELSDVSFNLGPNLRFWDHVGLFLKLRVLWYPDVITVILIYDSHNM